LSLIRPRSALAAYRHSCRHRWCRSGWAPSRPCRS